MLTVSVFEHDVFFFVFFLHFSQFCVVPKSGLGNIGLTTEGAEPEPTEGHG